MKNRNYAFFLLITLLFISSSTYALNPSRTYKQLPDKFNMVYEAFDVPTEDGATLKAWYFPAKNTERTTKLVLISHNGEGNMADYLRRVDQFTSIGCNVVTYDYRGFGESSEFEIDNNMYIYPHFQDDMKAMIDFCRQKFVQTFHLYGWGIGAGLSLGVGWNRLEVKAIIADTPFLSMEDLEERFAKWDEPMEVPFAGYDKKYEPIYSVDNEPVTLKNNTKNVLLMIGSNDILYSVADMENLINKNKISKAAFEKKPYVVENPDRKDNFRIDKAEYFKAMGAFLEGK